MEGEPDLCSHSHHAVLKGCSVWHGDREEGGIMPVPVQTPGPGSAFTRDNVHVT